MNVPPQSKRDRAPIALRLVVAFLFGLLVLAGCASQTSRHNLLRLFFDGVPVPGQTNAPAIQYDEDGRPLALNLTPQTNVLLAVAAPAFFSHAPYANNECAECHKSKFAVEMKGTQRDVCFACHDDFLEPAKAKFTHLPAANSECTSCHEPHGGSNKNMLIKLGKDLCMECHDDIPATAKVKHQPVENGECMSCHNAHAANEKGLLPMSYTKLCWECHDDFTLTEKAKFKHQPVENGECSSCHAPHHSEEKGLLIMSGQKLCFECHEEADIARSPAHLDSKNKLCLECHDPHIGESRALLRELIGTK